MARASVRKQQYGNYVFKICIYSRQIFCNGKKCNFRFTNTSHESIFERHGKNETLLLRSVSKIVYIKKKKCLTKRISQLYYGLAVMTIPFLDSEQNKCISFAAIFQQFLFTNFLTVVDGSKKYTYILSCNRPLFD